MADLPSPHAHAQAPAPADGAALKDPSKRRSAGATPPPGGRRRRWLGFSLLVLLGLGGGLLYADYRTFLNTPLGPPAAGLTVELKPGAGIAALVTDLGQQPGLLRRSWYWPIYARLNGLAQRLKAGEYALTADLTPRQLLARIVAGRVIQYSLTVVEGWTFRRLRQALASHPQIRPTVAALSDTELMHRLGRPGQAPEGWFLPDTYAFSKGYTDEQFLRRALAAMERQLHQVWERRIADLPLTSPYQALILASIIEKETAVPSERAEVAGVFIRRLRKGMRLQTDPTVIYGLGQDFDGNLRRADLTTDHPYNTYTRSGLPPTPIALPGADALAAAVAPAPGETLYFVASGIGGHVFSVTLEQHNQAVKRYQQRRR